MEASDGSRIRAFRVHGYVHYGLIPGIALGVAVVFLGTGTLIDDWPNGWPSVRFGFGFVCIVGSVIFCLSLVWQALIAYGLVPLVVVWRRGGAVWAGTVMATVGLSRRRLQLNGRDVKVELLGAPRPQEKSVQIFRPRITSGGVSLDLRSRGVIDQQELQEFLVSCADAYLGLPRTEGQEP